MELAISLLTTIICLIISLFVFLKNTKSATHVFFSSLVFFIGLYPIFNFLSLHATSNDEAFFWAKLILFTAIPAGPLFYFFVNTFPGHKLTVSKLALALFSVWIIINISFAASGLIFSSVEIVNKTPKIQPGPLVFSFGLLQILSLLLASISLIRKYKKSRGLLRRQLQFVTYGVITSFGLTALSTVILPLGFSQTFLIPISPLFLLVAGGSIAYSILRHRLLDIRLVLARTVSYTLLLIFFGVSYALLFGMATYQLIGTSLTPNATLISSALALIMAFTFQPLRRNLEKITDGIFYRDRYDSDKLLYDFTLIMASTLKIEQLTHEILNSLLRTIDVTHGAFILLEKGLISDVKSEGFKHEIVLDESEIDEIIDTRNTLVFDEMEEGNLKNILRNMDFWVLVHLRTEGEYIGFLALGPKKSGQIYSSQDLGLLEILAPEAAVALQNARAYEEIRRFNITLQEEIEKATSDLKSANEKLELLDKLKDEFVSVASHELRTPMTAIKSYAWLVLNGKAGDLNPKAREYLDRVYQSTERLIHLVNEMLDVSRIESGRVQLRPEPTDVHQLALDVQAEFSARAAETGLTLVVRPRGEIPRTMIDREKIHQVLENLVGNAFKFTPSGGRVTVSLEPKGEFVQVDVTDTGKGISESDMPRLFKKFGRLENSLVAIEGSGTGLGLFICKQYVELHHGTIGVTSEVGRGSTFTFTLPVAKL